MRKKEIKRRIYRAFENYNINCVRTLDVPSTLIFYNEMKELYIDLKKQDGEPNPILKDDPSMDLEF